MTFANDLFTGRTVVIPGGTSGIGAATAERFAALGARVVCCGLGAAGGPRSERIESRDINVLQPGALDDFFASLNQIDVLVNCTGVSRDRDEWKKEKFDEVIAINLTSVMDCCRLGRSRMTSGSSIINIASMYSTFGAADRPGYSASKGAIVQLTKSLAQEFAAENIRVNAVAPGWIVTPLSRALFADEVVSAPIRNRIPAGRWGEAAEVADAIVFLSSEVARYIAGVCLPVDGGYLTS
ncbi:SDR family oxidoreductase [Rhizobium leguminosarum]|uniref:SDR family NAD(P)-dependent oxidoreductase n=1 Tax=Rhizobium ruizarguesonis TaxID=2081791 RepID=UPI00103E3C66|nr:SDR family oxidoreductase [Rhizobium ruizarguesonis]MBY5848617.1 SDR family oxidoreductase [Rhizobium leguminosarum]TCA65405.1 SDR family oxidoreductase [Rhizobium leguminosarum bv. viciae]NEH89086.1 SDR family oxidoreductase [Rhizobium ruizarguesonis]NEI17351.1 SDR family oxidoreductase [Rhizobium ruizarguesonis]NEJ61501.1 SDR family oxidoreductase [Rhizobium ruizarguesonis]